MRDAKNIGSLSKLPIDYIGFIFYEKSARYIAEIPASKIPDKIKKTGVFVNAEEAYIRAKIESGLQAIQLHGQETPSFCQNVKTVGVDLIKAYGISKLTSWETLAPYVGVVDYFLFDTSSPQHGGTGKSFDWTLLKKYPYDVPYFLSGGLDISNLPLALKLQDPRLVGLDLNSRFEIKPGLKDIEKIEQALKIIRYE